MVDVEALSSIPFGALARLLAAEARRHELVVPAFSSPPRTPGANRTIRRLPGGGVMVAVRVRDRGVQDVIDDLVEGVLVANGLAGQAAVGWRLALRTVLGGEEAMAA